jgi:hypothetical protein
MLPTVLLILAIGAVGAACVLAKRVGPIVPFAFIAPYVLAVGATTFINIGVFDMVDPKFRGAWVWNRAPSIPPTCRRSVAVTSNLGPPTKPAMGQDENN